MYGDFLDDFPLILAAAVITITVLYLQHIT